MQVGFTVAIGRDGAAEIRLHGTGRDGAPPPFVDLHRSGAGAAVMLGRLYYRAEGAGAGEANGGCAAASEVAGDAAHAFAAYRCGGLAALERLEGDFALVVWDGIRRRLVGCRDPLGGYPLFWVERGGGAGIAFGTSMGPLLKMLPRRALDLGYIAGLLMVPGPVNERDGEDCAYQGIRRVAAGSWVTASLDAGYVERRVHWDWAERLVDPGTNRLADVAEGYAALLREAVRQRIRGRTVAHLSGGMDSTSVALLARDLIAQGAGETPLRTLSLVYRGLPALARERPYLEAALSAAMGAEPHLLPADELLDFDSFEDPPSHDEPYVGLWRLGMDRAMVRAAATLGADTTLTGIGADELLDAQPFHLADLLRNGRLRETWAEATRWAQHDNCSPWGILYPFGIARLVPGWTERGLGRLLPLPGRGRDTELGDWTVSPWIRRDFARRYDLQGRAREYARRGRGDRHSAALSFAVDSVRSRTGDVTRWCVAAPLGVAIAHPFLDVRLLRYGLGALACLRPAPGRPKPVLAEAMRGALPAAIRDRPRKGAFNEVYYLGLARNLPRLEAMVRDAPVDDLGIVDKEPLLYALRTAALGGAHVRQLHRLNLTLSLVRWLVMHLDSPSASGR